MNLEELGARLRQMYDSADDGESVAMIHLFGITYAAEIRSAGANATKVVHAAGLRESYATEVQKGMNLAKYVQPIRGS